MSRRSRALLAGNCHVAFNSQECAREFSISADRSIARKLHETSSPIIASTTRLPSDWLHIKITFEIRASPQRPSIGREIRLGLMRERRLDPDFLHSYSLGSDENSWAVSLRSRDVFHLHNNNHTRLAGVHFSDADHISIVLNRQHQTASFSLNDAQQLVCFQGVDERVVPLVSISAPAVCDVAILPCEVW
ncbi:hypothetical protein GUITHDRAFT_150683 [Guillardia theta CCMP2712]|uniref:B30.2/SPRY domain-containing protein n=1 Tax=Guillardia theta (strain CCMP2712) TaxID=905079 RepID=L1JVH5_GUITC|nr:hypothetical protein GUITHDRAFT_150683 [Guillardia theta CCMP2712]EKX52103.1 hypothetical protein GUITHDRAFT_150683 [Guillardia theta CCMP2712]|eukprot:XP_005839083.1 hypothetical protein GUITHDRAFT_150683 [Guillardia theta CCMP2712]